MLLQAKLLNPAETVFLYGTTPPRAGSAEEVIVSAAGKLVERIGHLPIDGIVVYDIQDEAGRTHLPRPFPFTQTVDPREYGSRLQGLSHKPVLTYKCLGDTNDVLFRDWLSESARDYDVKFLSLVGRPTSRTAEQLSLDRALRIAAEHEANFSVGAVVIAERHTPQRSEVKRLFGKAAQGCQYFISQTVFHANNSIQLLADYQRECAREGVEARRIVLSFAPCGREKTMAFIKWLGVNVPVEIESRIFRAAQPLAESIEVCAENLRQILEQDYFGKIPIGLNVESVSINRDELNASVDLYERLLEVWRSVAG
jgi:hypothetical protein